MEKKKKKNRRKTPYNICIIIMLLLQEDKMMPSVLIVLLKIKNQEKKKIIWIKLRIFFFLLQSGLVKKMTDRRSKKMNQFFPFFLFFPSHTMLHSFYHRKTLQYVCLTPDFLYCLGSERAKFRFGLRHKKVPRQSSWDLHFISELRWGS